MGQVAQHDGRLAGIGDLEAQLGQAEDPRAQGPPDVEGLDAIQAGLALLAGQGALAQAHVGVGDLIRGEPPGDQREQCHDHQQAHDDERTHQQQHEPQDGALEHRGPARQALRGVVETGAVAAEEAVHDVGQQHSQYREHHDPAAYQRRERVEAVPVLGRVRLMRLRLRGGARRLGLRMLRRAAIGHLLAPHSSIRRASPRSVSLSRSRLASSAVIPGSSASVSAEAVCRVIDDSPNIRRIGPLLTSTYCMRP